METVSDQVYERTEVSVDGRNFIACRFDNCSLSYNGGSPARFEKCIFKDCEWIFTGAGDRTIELTG